MHPVLEKQIKQHLGEQALVSPKMKAFFESVNEAYTYLDEERAVLNRSLVLDSKEIQKNTRLLKQAKTKAEKKAQNLAFKVAKRTEDLNKRITELEDVRRAMSNLLHDFEEEQKALAEAKDDALLNSIGEGMVAIDEDGKIVVANKVAGDLLGFTSAEMVGKLFIQMVSLEDDQGNQIPDTQRPIAAALASGKIATVASCYFVREKGIRFPATITAAPVILDAKTIGVIIVFRDTKKEKAIEKMRVDFLSLASHQLRTPLSGTKWLIDTMRREVVGTVTEKQKEYLDDIYKINERMIKLVSEMLNVLMLESGVATLKKQTIPVGELFKELFLIMEPASRNKGVVLKNAFKDSEALFIQSDSQIMRSILESLVSNAINYSRSGQEVVLDVKENSGSVVFLVKDNGIGIPEDEQKKITERFYRASNAKLFKPDGTGLGLYIAFLLAQKVGGKISFESKENMGTTFYLQVPRKVDSGNSFNNNLN